MAQPLASTRRAMLGGSAAALLAGAAAASPAPSADAALVRICHAFAEAEWRNWWRYIVAPADLADAQATDPDWTTLKWITATPATTPAGWAAKALAVSAWEREFYDDLVEAERDTRTTLLAGLLHDMVAPVRTAILARCKAEYGPLGEGYDADARWIGRTPAIAMPVPPRPAPLDAELHAACADFARAERDVAQLERGAEDDVFEAAVAESHAAVVRLSGLRARTVSGLRAKAGVCRAVYMADEPAAMAGTFGGKAQRHDVLAWSTLADMAEAGA